jgi:hypothetical protein
VVVSRGQLDFLKAKIAAGEQPWTGIADALKRQSFASLTYRAKPVPEVICGSYSNPSVGCADEWRDGMAAYAQALLWYVTGNEDYARNAVAIMNAWSSTLKGHSNSNGPLQQGWAGATWPRGAEIIRHTYDGWAPADIERFETMLRTQYLPGVINGSGANGNWELTMIDAAIGIGVFLDDKAAFDKAVTMWRERVPAYFYMASDGPKPVPSPRGSTNWQGATVYMDGIAQETCRDLTHTQYGIASTMYVAETALIQGIDLYKEQEQRRADDHTLDHSSTLRLLEVGAHRHDPTVAHQHDAVLEFLAWPEDHALPANVQRRRVLAGEDGCGEHHRAQTKGEPSRAHGHACLPHHGDPGDDRWPPPVAGGASPWERGAGHRSGRRRSSGSAIRRAFRSPNGASILWNAREPWPARARDRSLPYHPLTASRGLGWVPCRFQVGSRTRTSSRGCPGGAKARRAQK